MHKKEKFKQLSNKNGITLIALVVTIIVLIILAAVSISLILGENGIITKSRDAARRTEEARLNEEVATNELMEQWDGLVGGSSTPVEGIRASDIEADASYIGKYVNYGGQETFKGVKWRIFNAENGQIQLIADNYIHKDVMPIATNILIGDVNKPDKYGVKAKDSRITLLNYINTTSNWSEFVAVTGATVTGSPTIEQFKNSYNRTHGVNSEETVKEIFIAKSEVMDDGLEGYYVGTSESPTTIYIYGLNTTEMENLYVISNSTNAEGYWLGSPSVAAHVCALNVNISGIITANPYDNNSSFGLRPLVSLPSGSILVEQEDGRYNIHVEENLNKPTEIKTVEEMKAKKDEYMPTKTTLKDSNGNLIVVPEGFKIAEDSGINVTEGIVIEDNDIIEGVGNDRGNQYVWIPVGENIKKKNKNGTIEEVDITLGRYVFADGRNHKDEFGNLLTAGTPILKQSEENYEYEIGINRKELKTTASSYTVDFEFKELKISREGKADESDNLQDVNTTALNLKGFIESVNKNGGYYIARYEATYGEDKKANSKVSDDPNNFTTAPTQEGYLWNNITQIDAAAVSRGLYEKVHSDLINSYAWDTAVLYIQEFTEYKTYSLAASKYLHSRPTNTGTIGDEYCKINDMSSNTMEWSTEYSTYKDDYKSYPCTARGGCFYGGGPITTGHNEYQITYKGIGYTFRTILYI